MIIPFDTEMMAQRFIFLVTILFTLFMAWIIFLADSGRKMLLFDLVRRTPYGDKLGHFILAGFFALILNLLLKMKGFRIGALFIPYGSPAVFVLFLVEEASQRFIPGRTCDIMDLAADMAGIILVSLVLSSPGIRRRISTA